jgi:PAS domain S-box-containing protein
MSIKMWIFVLLVILSVVPVIILDSVTPLGHGEVILYFFPVLLSSITSNKTVIYSAMVLTFILMIIGYFTSPPGIWYISIINRIGVFVINWFVVWLILKRMSTIKKLQQSQINERENREFLDTILNNANIAIAVLTGRDLKFTYVNPAYQSVRPDTDMLGKSYYDVFPEHVEKGIERMILNVIDTGVSWRIQRYQMTFPGKSDNVWEGKVVPLLQGISKQEKSALLLVWDVTEWDLLERNLRKREQEYSTLAEHAPEIIARFDHQFRHIYINEYGSKVYGIPSEKITGKTNDDLGILREKKDFWKQQFEQVFDSGQMKIINYEYESPKLGHLFLSSLFVPEYDGEKNVVSILVITRDITELKKNENQLRESEKRFRELANSMPQLVWTVGADGTVDYCNERYRDLRRIKPEPDRKQQWGLVVHQDDLEVTMSRWAHAVKSGETYEVEHRIRHADGSYHWYLSRAVPVRDENDKIIKWYGTTTNIDLIKKALHDLETNEKKLKILNENLEDMVIQRTTQVRALSFALSLAEQRERKRISYVLHENLLQKLLGARLLLGQHFRDHENQISEKCQPDDIADSIGLLEEAIDTTRFLSIELNPPILQSQGLDASLKWLVKHMKKAYRLDVKMNIRGKVNSVRNEKQLMLTQMVRELLNNVIKHSGVKDAQIEAVNENGQIQITVSDKGRGFNPDEALRRSNGDARLSLFSIRERLNLFNGELKIISREGQGTTCIIRLPDNNY